MAVTLAERSDQEKVRRRKLLEVNKIRGTLKKFSNAIRTHSLTLPDAHTPQLLYNRIRALLKGKEKTQRGRRTFNHTQSRNIHQQWTCTLSLSLVLFSLSISQQSLHPPPPPTCLLVHISPSRSHQFLKDIWSSDAHNLFYCLSLLFNSYQMSLKKSHVLLFFVYLSHIQ